MNDNPWISFCTKSNQKHYQELVSGGYIAHWQQPDYILEEKANYLITHIKRDSFFMGAVIFCVFLFLAIVIAFFWGIDVGLNIVYTGVSFWALCHSNYKR